MWLTPVMPNRHKRPIGAHFESVFARAKFPDPGSLRTAPDHMLTPMTGAEPEHALARGLEGKKSG
jgi:hypothetical protein